MKVKTVIRRAVRYELQDFLDLALGTHWLFYWVDGYYYTFYDAAVGGDTIVGDDKRYIVGPELTFLREVHYAKGEYHPYWYFNKEGRFEPSDKYIDRRDFIVVKALKANVLVPRDIIPQIKKLDKEYDKKNEP